MAKVTLTPLLRRPDERGAAALAYVGITLVAALLVGAVATSVAALNPGLASQMSCSVALVLNPDSPACDAVPSAVRSAVPSTRASSGSREDEERATRDNRRDDVRGNRSTPEPSSTSTPVGGTSGGKPFPDGLGDPVPGTTAPVPEPPAWTPPDPGSPHGSETPNAADRAVFVTVEIAANASAGNWPDASRNLLHYLANNGETFNQDVNKMLADSAAFKDAADTQQERLIALAVERAKAAGATGPTTVPVNTDWTGFYLSEPKDWFLALGGIAFNQTGTITVSPPTTPGGKWSYESSLTVNIRDRYNWDGGKSTQIGPFNVTDEQLARLQKVGLAQEYTAVGASDVRQSKGQTP